MNNFGVFVGWSFQEKRLNWQNRWIALRALEGHRKKVRHITTGCRRKAAHDFRPRCSGFSMLQKAASVKGGGDEKRGRRRESSACWSCPGSDAALITATKWLKKPWSFREKHDRPTFDDHPAPYASPITIPRCTRLSTPPLVLPVDILYA